MKNIWQTPHNEEITQSELDNYLVPWKTISTKEAAQKLTDGRFVRLVKENYNDPYQEDDRQETKTLHRS